LPIEPGGGAVLVAVSRVSRDQGEAFPALVKNSDQDLTRPRLLPVKSWPGGDGDGTMAGAFFDYQRILVRVPEVGMILE
jgi:hypothetical protein